MQWEYRTEHVVLAVAQNLQGAIQSQLEMKGVDEFELVSAFIVEQIVYLIFKRPFNQNRNQE